jgi:hypothetical protein
MKKVKFIVLCMGFLLSGIFVYGQSSLTIDASQQMASFKFTNSFGDIENQEYDGIFVGAYGAGYRFVAENGIMFRAGLGMRKAGATLVYDAINYSWDLQYASVMLGGGYMYKTESIHPYLNISGYYGYLLRGYQSINNENFNIKTSEALFNTDYGVIASPGVQITLSDAISAYFEFNYLMGLQNIEKDEGQVAYNFAYGASLGISFTLVK